MLDAAAARGYPIKVVLLANEGDTGGDPALLEDAQSYVTTVSAELEAVVRPVRDACLEGAPATNGNGRS